MSYLNVDINDNKIYEYIDSFSRIVYVMQTTFANFAPILERNTKDYVPLLTGDLEHSYFYKITSNSNFVELEVGYTAVNNGYDYSIIQHENEYYHHPLRGEDKYLIKGISDSSGTLFTMLESDFLSLFGGVL